MTNQTLPLHDTLTKHPDAERAVIRKWASGTTHYAWVGGWPHSVDMTEVMGHTVIVARPPLRTFCWATIRGPWPFRQAGDLVICMDEPEPNCRQCRTAAGLPPRRRVVGQGGVGTVAGSPLPDRSQSEPAASVPASTGTAPSDRGPSSRLGVTAATSGTISAGTFGGGQ